jgi:hypothetical protein
MKACTRFVFSGPPSRWCIIIFLSVSLGVEFCFLTNQSLLNHLDWFVDCFAEIQEHGIKKVNPSITFLILNYFIFFNNLTFNISIANGTSMPLNISRLLFRLVNANMPPFRS